MALPARGIMQIRSGDGEHVIALYRPLALAYFSRPPKDSELATLRTLIEEAVAEGTTGGMLFAVARRNITGGIDPRVRNFFEQLVKENAGKFGASAVAVLMKGFAASLMRSFITGLLLLTGKRDIQIFASVDAACRWLAPLHNIDTEALIQAYQSATADITDRAPLS